MRTRNRQRRVWLGGVLANGVGIGLAVLMLVLLQAQRAAGGPASAGVQALGQVLQTSRELPVVVKSPEIPTTTPGAEDPVVNGSFEADWGEEMSHWVKVFPVDGEPYLTEIGEFHTPPGWLAWFRHDPGTWDQPEVGDIRARDVPYRVRSGEKAARLFTFYRRHDAGFMQQVSVQPGAQLTLTAHAHAWSNHPLDGYEDCADHPHCSAGVGQGGHFLLPDDVPPLNGDPWNDAVGNFALELGIDPTGGTDPFADSVQWGTTAYVYNEYHQVPQVRARAEVYTVTIFLRSRTKWPFKHNDAYWDDVELDVSQGYRIFLPLLQTGPISIEWNYPVITEGSKIGVHAIISRDWTEFPQQLVDGGTRFPVIKTVDNFGWVFDVAQKSPETIFIGRKTWPGGEGCQGVGEPDFDMEEYARLAIQRILDVIDANDGLEEIIDYWEPYNEPDPNEPTGVEGHKALAQLMIETMEEAESHGLKIALFSFNTGTPEWEEMEAIVETGVFAKARAGGHIMALHEGTLTSHDPKSGWGPILDWPPVDGAGFLNFRYRYLYHLLKQRNEVIPLVVSEWYCGEEADATAQTLVDGLTWYDDQASEDYYVWGVLPFTLGPTSQWEHTDYLRVYPDVVDYMIRIKDRENDLPPGWSLGTNLAGR